MLRKKRLEKSGLTYHEIKRWGSTQGVFLLQAGKVQVLFRDNKTPVSIGFFRPYNLLKEDGCITGTFFWEIKALKYRRWLMGPYYRCLKAFSVEVEPKDLDILFRPDSETHYLSLEEREKISGILAEKEGDEAWLKLKPQDSYSPGDWLWQPGGFSKAGLREPLKGVASLRPRR